MTKSYDAVSSVGNSPESIPELVPTQATFSEPAVSTAFGFLEVAYPKGPWCLTAIDPDRKAKIETRTFHPGSAEDCQKWIKSHNGSRNLYWHVNPVRSSLGKKAQREDIESVCYLHVDIDPRPTASDVPLASLQNEILSLLTDRLPAGVPEPTFIIFSGGGYQAFWKLREPLRVEGDIERAEDAKLYNKGLEKLLGGDNCHNIDRLMRLPFTMNLPDARKKSKGRSAALSKLVICKPDRAYPLDMFERSEPERTTSARIDDGQSTVDLDEGVSTIEKLEDLDRWSVPERVKRIIAHGHDPDREAAAAKKDNSRSAWLFDAIFGLLRCGVPDAFIVGIITDSRWTISESVVEKGRGAKKYAIRQVGRAKEKCERSAGAIVVNNPVVAEVRRAIEKLFLESDLEVFRQDKRLVRVSVVEKTVMKDGVVRRAGLVELVPVSGVWLADKASELGRFVAMTANGPRRVAPKRDHMAALLEMTDESRFPLIKGLSLTPTLRCDEPGYDDESQLFLAFPEGVFPKVSMTPTRHEAVAALNRLRHPLRGFPFVDAAARSVALSAMISAVVRGEMATCPLHGFDAPAAGTGKTKLALMAGILALGVEPPSVTYGEDADENQKQLSSLLMTGVTAILLDNVDVPLKGAFLNGILTKDGFDTRILGLSKMVRLNTRALLMATGNNLQSYGDMARRTVVCRMDAKMSNPEDRKFDFDPVAEVRASRPQLVVDALTIVRGYLAAGSPTRLSAYGSFDDWEVVRGALVWLGEADPLETKARVAASNPRQQERAELILSLYRHYGTGRHFKLADIDGQDELDRYTLKAQLGRMLRSGRWHKGEVGQLMASHKEVPFMGVVLLARQNRIGVNEWWLDGEAEPELVDEAKRSLRPPPPPF